MLYRNRIIDQRYIRNMNLNETIPDNDSFFYKAFEANKEIAEKTLHTRFIQGIKNGTLSPDMYGSFTVLDSYYCYNAAYSFRIASTKAKDQGMSDLLSILSYLTYRYEKFNMSFLKLWHIANISDITPTNLWQAYVMHEREVAENEHPIYTLVSMLPCYHLWYWLSDQLMPYSENNLYGSWIKSCHYPDGAYLLGLLIQYWQNDGKVFDDSKALEIYRVSMKYEYQNFDDTYHNYVLNQIVCD